MYVNPQSPTLGLINPSELSTDTAQQDENLVNPAAAYGAKQQANDLKALAMQQKLSQQMLSYGHNAFPQLDFSSSANWGEGLAKGLGNAMSIHQHQEQQRQAKAQDMAMADVMAGIQKKADAAQAAQAEQEQGVADMVDGLTFKTPDGKVMTGAQLGLGKFMKANPAFGKALFTHLGNTYGDAIPQPFVGTQAGLGDNNKTTVHIQGATDAGAGPDVMNGVVDPKTGVIAPATPAQQTISRAYMGFEPTTSSDVNAKELANTGKGINNSIDRNTLGNQPQQLQEEAQQRQLAIKNSYEDWNRKIIDNHFATRDHELEQEAKVARTTKEMAEAQKYNDGKAWWNDPKTQAALANTDPRVQHFLVSKAAMYGIPYQPYTEKISSVRDGNGSYHWYNADTHQIFINDKWQDIGHH